MKYKVKHHEITGIKGKSFLKGQTVDESQLIADAIEHLKSIDAIEVINETEEPKKVTKKTAEKAE
jgi:hypothetical protein